MAYPEAKDVMFTSLIIVFISFAIVISHGGLQFKGYISEEGKIEIGEGKIKLPPPILKGVMSVEEAISKRRSIREYSKKPLTLKELGQILWAAQGITEPKRKFRAAPSAGATYPLELYIVVKEGGVEGLEAGIYHYDPYTHSIELVKRGDYSYELYKACLEQQWVLDAPVNIVIAAVFERTTRYYGERGVRYVYMEAGHVGENIYLQAVALNLGTVAIGAFYDDRVHEIIGSPKDCVPIYVFPVGHRV